MQFHIWALLKLLVLWVIVSRLIAKFAKNVGFYFFLNVPFLISNYPNGKKNKDICIQYYSHKNFIVEIQSYASIKPT